MRSKGRQNLLVGDLAVIGIGTYESDTKSDATLSNLLVENCLRLS